MLLVFPSVVLAAAFLPPYRDYPNYRDSQPPFFRPVPTPRESGFGLLRMAPVRDTAFGLDKIVEANFWHQKLNEQIEVNMILRTKVPTYNLNANSLVFKINEITAVDCTDDEIRLTFSRPEFAEIAFQSWSSVPEWVAMVDYTSCATTLLSVKVSKMKLQGNQIVVPNQKIQIENYVEEFEVKVNSKDDSSKSGPWPWQKGDGKGKQVAFNLNFNPNTSSISNPLITIYESQQGSIKCSDCYAKGSLNYGAIFKGRGLVLDSFSFFAHGEIVANSDLVITAYSGTSKQMQAMKMLASLDFGVIGSPGLFAIQSTISIASGVKLKAEATEDINAKFGYDLNVPYSLNISSDNVFGSIPKVQGSFKPKFTPHPYQTSQVQYTIEGRLTPALDFGFSLLGKKIGYAMEIDCGVGAELQLGSEICPKALVLDMYQFGTARLRTNNFAENQFLYLTLWSRIRSRVQCATSVRFNHSNT